MRYNNAVEGTPMMDEIMMDIAKYLKPNYEGEFIRENVYNRVWEKIELWFKKHNRAAVKIAQPVATNAQASGSLCLLWPVGSIATGGCFVGGSFIECGKSPCRIIHG